MFLFLARQLLGLKKLEDPLFTRRYYLLEVKDENFLFYKIYCFLEFEHGSIIYTGS
jgi:hypothetical protein